MTVGQIVNHMSTDAKNLMNLSEYMHYLWSVPFQVSTMCLIQAIECGCFFLLVFSILFGYCSKHVITIKVFMRVTTIKGFMRVQTPVTGHVFEQSAVPQLSHCTSVNRVLLGKSEDY